MVSLDAGFASQQNLTRLRELGYSYLINLTRGSRQNYAAEFCQWLTGKRPTKRALELIRYYLMGYAELEEVMTLLGLEKTE